MYKLRDAEVACSQGFRLFYIKIYISNQILWVFAMARGELGGRLGGVPAQALLQSARGRCLPRKVRGRTAPLPASLRPPFRFRWLTAPSVPGRW